MKDKSPNFVFLVQSKANDVCLESVSKTLGFLDCFNVNFLGKRGRLALLWKQDMKVDIVSLSQWHIYARMEVEGPHPKWLLINFYAEPDTNKQSFS